MDEPTPVSLRELLTRIGPGTAAPLMERSRQLLYGVKDGTKGATRDTIVRAHHAFPGLLDLTATVAEEHPDWTPDRVAFEVRLIDGLARAMSDEDAA